MSRMDYRTLIDRGRKAGLGTSEIYRALASRQPEVGDHSQGQADGNGFVSGIGTNGQRIYQPTYAYRRS